MPVVPDLIQLYIDFFPECDSRSDPSEGLPSFASSLVFSYVLSSISISTVFLSISCIYTHTHTHTGFVALMEKKSEMIDLDQQKLI